MLTRPIATDAGITARASALASAARSDAKRFTVPCTSATDPTVHRTEGSSIENDEKPNTRADSPMSQIDSGGLSTVMKLPGSSDPKNSAFHDSLADFTAAA